jgi:hypothetical protein
MMKKSESIPLILNYKQGLNHREKMILAGLGD